MLCRAAALLLAVVLSAAPVSTQMKIGAPPGDFVELDVVVLDRKGQPYHGLTKADFTVKDTGKAVALATFREVRGPDPADPDAARTVVLLLDDTGVASTGTQSIQIIANAFLDMADRRDDVPVVRLHARDDEPYGDRIAGAERIAAYRAGAFPFAYWSTAGEMLQRVSGLSRAVADNTSKRKVLVCIGAGFVCNVSEPDPASPGSFDRGWQAAISDAATANVSLYALVPGRGLLRPGSMADVTGGDVFSLGYNVAPVIERILRDASNYYVLGYWPVVEGKNLRRVEVKVKAKGSRVLARKLR